MQEKFNEVIGMENILPQNEPWASHPEGGILFVRHPSDTDIDNIHMLTKTEIATSTVPLAVIKAVYKHNRDNFWGLYRATDASKTDARFVGYYGVLLLNQAGRELLERGEFDASNPDLSLLAPGGTRPAAIYVWAVVARKLTRLASPLVTMAVGSRYYFGIPIYATAGTLGGLSSLKEHGFVGARQSEAGLGGLLRLDPAPHKATDAA